MGGVQNCNISRKSEVKASGTDHEPALAKASGLFFEIP